MVLGFGFSAGGFLGFGFLVLFGMKEGCWNERSPLEVVRLFGQLGVSPSSCQTPKTRLTFLTRK